MDDSTKIWTFTEKWLAPTLALIKLIGVNPVVITRAQAGASAGASSSRKPIDAVLLDFVKLLPFDAAQSAYRKAALAFHPDKGGDMARMSALNAAWERIQKEVYQQS